MQPVMNRGWQHCFIRGVHVTVFVRMQPVMNRGWQQYLQHIYPRHQIVRMQPVMNRGWQLELVRCLYVDFEGPNATRDE